MFVMLPDFHFLGVKFGPVLILSGEFIVWIYCVVLKWFVIIASLTQRYRQWTEETKKFEKYLIPNFMSLTFLIITYYSFSLSLQSDVFSQFYFHQCL